MIVGTALGTKLGILCSKGRNGKAGRQESMLVRTQNLTLHSALWGTGFAYTG